MIAPAQIQPQQPLPDVGNAPAIQLARQPSGIARYLEMARPEIIAPRLQNYFNTHVAPYIGQIRDIEHFNPRHREIIQRYILERANEVPMIPIVPFLRRINILPLPVAPLPIAIGDIPPAPPGRGLEVIREVGGVMFIYADYALTAFALYTMAVPAIIAVSLGAGTAIAYKKSAHVRRVAHAVFDLVNSSEKQIVLHGLLMLGVVAFKSTTLLGGSYVAGFRLSQYLLKDNVSPFSVAIRG